MKSNNLAGIMVNKKDLSKDNVGDKIGRTKIILEQSNLLYNRLENNISLLKTRISNLLAIIITTFSVELTLIQIFLQNNGTFPPWVYIISILPFLILMTVSVIVLISLFRVKKYKDVDIFENDQFKEICKFNKEDLLSDFLYFIKDSYQFNKKAYDKDIKQFKNSFYLFVGGNAYLLIFLIIIFLIKLLGE